MTHDEIITECTAIEDLIPLLPLEACARLYVLKESLPDGGTEAEQLLIERLHKEASKACDKH